MIRPAPWPWQSTQLFGSPRLVLLKRLNASARNCSETLSFRANFFANTAARFEGHYVAVVLSPSV